MGNHLPKRRQRMNRIKHPGQKCCRHDQEILERRQLVELVSPDPRNQSHGTEKCRPQYRKNNDPPWRNE